MRYDTRSPSSRWAGLLGLVLASCSQAPRPESLPPQTVTPIAGPSHTFDSAPAVRPPVEAAPPPSKAREAANDSEAAKDPTLVVISTQDGARVTPESLIAASRAERERRRSGPGPVAVITNKNLAEYAEGVTLTYALGTMEEPVEEEGDANGEEGSDAEPLFEERDEAYWRERSRAARSAWKRTVEEIDDLEKRAAELRQRFYAEDDPYVRDGRIKPDWDWVLEQLSAATQREAVHQRELEALLQEGHRAGALPGWMREGIELEPQQEGPKEQLEELDPREPVIMDEDPEDPEDPPQA